MTNKPSYIADLLVKSLLNTLSKKERKGLNKWLKKRDENRLWIQNMRDSQWLEMRWLEYMAIDEREGWEELRSRIPELEGMEYPEYPVRRLSDLSWLRNKAAIWILLAGLVLTGIYVASLFRHPKSQQQVMASAPTNHEVLLVCDGQPIALQDLHPGWSQQIANMDISIPEEGLVKVAIRDPSVAMGTLILSTPMRQKYRMLMPDSTLVSLDTATTLALVEFSPTRRIVKIEGEGYFEVKHIEKLPFVVRIPRTGVNPEYTNGSLLSITAIGTTFNVKAYENDSSIRATLVLGRLQVQREDDATIRYLTEGNSYVLYRDGRFEIRKDDIQEAVSWRYGAFVFQARPLDEILQELARAYDVRIEYADTPTGTYTLRGTRNETLQTILERLEGANHLHFSFADRRVIVSQSH
jgi:transmembrane sensor